MKNQNTYDQQQKQILNNSSLNNEINENRIYKKSISIQVDTINTNLKRIIEEIDFIHQQEKQALQEQITFLEKQLQKQREKQLLKSIEEIKNVYRNQVELNLYTQTALIELEELINEKLSYEVSDLKYRLHQAEKVLKVPQTELKTYPVDKLVNSIKKCQQFEMNESNFSNILDELSQADTEWNELSKNIYQENNTILNQLQVSTQNIAYELYLLDCKK